MSKTGSTAMIMLVLLTLPLLAGVPEEVLVLTHPGAVVFPPEETEVTLGQIQASQALMECLQSIGVQTVSMAMPDFDPADTAEVAPDGGIARLPDFSNLFILRLPTGNDRDSSVELLEQQDEVVYAEKNQECEPFGYPETPNDWRFPEQGELGTTTIYLTAPNMMLH